MGWHSGAGRGTGRGGCKFINCLSDWGMGGRNCSRGCRLHHNLALLENVVDIPYPSLHPLPPLLLQVPERVRAMNASIKLLLIVREPVTRAISDYTQLRSHAATAILPLAESGSSSSGSSGAGSGYGARMPATQSTLYTKLQSAQGYDNALGGSGAGAKETAQSTARRRAAGGATTTTTPTPSAAQLAAK